MVYFTKNQVINFKLGMYHPDNTKVTNKNSNPSGTEGF